MILIRRIKSGEGLLYKKMRLASLFDSPSAFSTTFESANNRNLEIWNKQADSAAVGVDKFIFFAFFNENPVGIVALYRDDQNKDSGEVIQFWIDREHRGGFVAGKLIEEIFSWAKKYNFKCLKAWINTRNERAIRFFRKYGFELTTKTQPFQSGSDQMSCLMTKQIIVEKSDYT